MTSSLRLIPSNHSTQTLVFPYCKLRQTVLLAAVLQPLTAQTSWRCDTPHAAKSHVRPSVLSGLIDACNSDVCCRGASPAVTLSGIQTGGTLSTSHDCRILLRAFHRHRLPTRSLPTEAYQLRGLRSETSFPSGMSHLSSFGTHALDHVTLNTRVPCPICQRQ